MVLCAPECVGVADPAFRADQPFPALKAALNDVVNFPVVQDKLALGVMQEGGSVCLWTRCWWTPELQDQVVELEQLLTRTLAPVVAKNTTPTSWLKGSKRGQRLGNPGIVARMLQEIE